MINIPASSIEFVEGGNTLWVHDTLGGTTLRIKCSGKIKVERCTVSPLSHSDVMVQGDINICIADNAEGK